MDIILIRGTYDSGKTTTAALVYEALLKTSSIEHYFDGKTVSNNCLKYNKKGDVIDFQAILTVKGKVVVIISAGDEVDKLIINIKIIIKLVREKLLVNIDVLICCGRSQNRQGSAYIKLKKEYQSSKLTEVWPKWAEKKSDIKKVKEESVKQIIKLV